MKLDITSISNPKIKWLRSLHSNSTRKKEGVFLVEGAKEIAMALDGGYQPHSFFMASEVFEQGSTLKKARRFSKKSQDFKTLFAGLNLVSISKDCFEKVAYRKNSDGLLAVFFFKIRENDALKFVVY